MIFLLLSLALLYFGRKIGWLISKKLLYRFSVFETVAPCIAWGMMVALGIHGLILWTHPGLLLRWIFGYGLGCYVSIPNFGLFNFNSIPANGLIRQMVITNLSLITFIVYSIILNN